MQHCSGFSFVSSIFSSNGFSPELFDFMKFHCALFFLFFPSYEGSGNMILKSPRMRSPTPTSPYHRYYVLTSPLSSCVQLQLFLYVGRKLGSNCYVQCFIILMSFASAYRYYVLTSPLSFRIQLQLCFDVGRKFGSNCYDQCFIWTMLYYYYYYYYCGGMNLSLRRYCPLGENSHGFAQSHIGERRLPPSAYKRWA